MVKNAQSHASRARVHEAQQEPRSKGTGEPDDAVDRTEYRRAQNDSGDLWKPPQQGAGQPDTEYDLLDNRPEKHGEWPPHIPFPGA